MGQTGSPMFQKVYITRDTRQSSIFTSISASITASQEASEYRIRTSAAVEQGSTPWWRISFGPLVKQVYFYQLCINESPLLFFGLRQFARAESVRCVACGRGPRLCDLGLEFHMAVSAPRFSCPVKYLLSSIDDAAWVHSSCNASRLTVGGQNTRTRPLKSTETSRWERQIMHE